MGVPVISVSFLEFILVAEITGGVPTIRRTL